MSPVGNDHYSILMTQIHPRVLHWYTAHATPRFDKKKLKLTQVKYPNLTRRNDHGPKGPKANLVVKLGSSSREVLMT